MNIIVLLEATSNPEVNVSLLNDAKLWSAIIAGAVALLTSITVSVVSSRLQKRTNFINSITSKRVNWMNRLRELIDDFVTMTRMSNNSEVYNTLEERLKYFEGLSHVKNQIILHLNYKGLIDKEIINHICQITSRIEVLYEIFEMIEIKEPVKRYKYVLAKFGDKIFGEIVNSMGGNKEGMIDLMTRYALGKDIEEKKVELIDPKIKKFNRRLKKIPPQLYKEIEGYHNELFKYVHVYLKLEWNRIKEESRGKWKYDDSITTYNKKVEVMLKEYDLSIHNYEMNKLAEYISGVDGDE